MLKGIENIPLTGLYHLCPKPNCTFLVGLLVTLLTLMGWEIKCDNISKHLLGSCAVFSDLPYICIGEKGGLGHRTYINPYKMIRDYWVYVIVKLTIMIQGHYIVNVTTVAFPRFPSVLIWPTDQLCKCVWKTGFTHA